METLGQYVRRIREARGMSQGDLAAVLSVGMSSISRRERENGPWSDSDLGKLAEALGVPLATLRAYRAADLQRITAPRLNLDTAPASGTFPLIRVPVLGRAPAGNPTEAVMDTGEYVTVPGADARGLFALRVTGDSMIPAMRDGDTAICRWIDPYETSVAVTRGDVVLVTFAGDGDGAFFRWLPLGDGRVSLVKDNPAFQPRTVTREQIGGMSKVVGVYRSKI